MKDILIIITGSVAAFKTLELIRLFVKNGDKVKVVLSGGAENFITPLSVSALSGSEVITKDTYKMEHISLSRKADLIIVCPASASFINKLALGIGGEISLDIFLAKKKETKVLIAPAMNVQMWENEVVKSNIVRLSEMGYKILSPIAGELLCKEEGVGKLANIEDIFNESYKIILKNNSLAGKKFLITNGGTVEKIDDVRFISNFSSGLQGALIAQELLERGGEVYMVEGSVSYNITLPGVNLFKFKILSALDMHKQVFDLIKNHKFEAFFAVAAVCDFRVKNRVIGKVSKENMFDIELIKNPDILYDVANLQINKPLKIVGFAAEEAINIEVNGEKKFKNKSCDVLFANEMCFEMKETKGIIFTSSNKETFYGSKQLFACKLVDLIGSVI